MISRLILLLAIAVSVGYFIRVVWRRLEPMRRAKLPLPQVQLFPKLWKTFTEVMFQTRVIRGRPLAGVLHALVMWGFFAFAWVSMEHMAAGFSGLASAERDNSWYGTFAAAWAVAVLFGIIGLAYRRFVMRPPQLGPPRLGGTSASSGIIALLIVLLMVTYLLGWRGFAADSAAWRINWWFHTASLLGMLFAIPSSKHLHLLLGPVAIFFRGETTSSIRALRDEDDDDFGMLSFKDLSAKDILDVHSCVECGRCTDVCPANVIGGTLDPKEVILQMQHGLLAGAEVVTGTAWEVEKGEA